MLQSSEQCIVEMFKRFRKNAAFVLPVLHEVDGRGQPNDNLQQVTYKKSLYIRRWPCGNSMAFLVYIL